MNKVKIFAVIDLVFLVVLLRLKFWIYRHVITYEKNAFKTLDLSRNCNTGQIYVLSQLNMDLGYSEHPCYEFVALNVQHFLFYFRNAQEIRRTVNINRKLMFSFYVFTSSVFWNFLNSFQSFRESSRQLSKLGCTDDCILWIWTKRSGIIITLTIADIVLKFVIENKA